MRRMSQLLKVTCRHDIGMILLVPLLEERGPAGEESEEEGKNFVTDTKIIKMLCIFIGRVGKFCVSLVFAVNGERLLWTRR